VKATANVASVNMSDPCHAADREIRRARLLSVTLCNHRLGELSMVARNLSEHGIGGRASPTPRVGERLLIAIPGHRRLMGTVRWAVGNRFGILTDHPIQIDQVRVANGEPLSTLDDRPQFQLLEHRRHSTPRPSLSLGQPTTGRDTSDWLGD